MFAIAMFDFAVPLLAQMSKKGLSDQDRSEIFFWLTVLTILAVIASVVGFFVYRKVKKADERTPEEQDFSLSQMRRLYEAGEISHDEFLQVRERILEASRRELLGMRDTMPRVIPPEEASQTEEEITSTDTALGEGNTDSTTKHDEPPTNEELHQDDDEKNRER